MTKTLRVIAALLALAVGGCNRFQTSKPGTADTAASGAHALEFTDADFETQVLRAEQPVMVMFTAPWCGPCRALKPVVHELAGEHEGAVKIGMVDVDDNPVVSERYGVSGIPALVFFKNGREVDRFIGVQTKDTLQNAINGVK